MCVRERKKRISTLNWRRFFLATKRAWGRRRFFFLTTLQNTTETTPHDGQDARCIHTKPVRILLYLVGGRLQRLVGTGTPNLVGGNDPSTSITELLPLLPLRSL